MKTDAREIIARAIEPFVHHADDVTSVVANTLTTTGLRILGPDEVDPVTVEKAARIADEQANEEDGAEGFLASKTIEDAIRALGRKA